eukprot:scaffold90_cov105-Cylindrotheca_fusiformis.AAC.3
MMGGIQQYTNRCIGSKLDYHRPSTSSTRSKKRKLGEDPAFDFRTAKRATDYWGTSPSMYLTAALKNKGISFRIDHLSVEQALYFEPYRESRISSDLLQALRRNDLKLLRTFDTEELSQTNQFGESLLHLVCRFGLNSGEYLVEEAKLPLNVRDKFGRSPLHNACLTPIPNFDTVLMILKNSPKLVIFEDNKGNTPFECIPARNHGKWSRFLSEERILNLLQSALVGEERN